MRAMIVPLAHRTTQTMFDQIFEDLPIAMLVLRNQPTPQPSVAALPGYGLTPAESELAVAIAQGISLRDHADSRDVSIHTVRAQLKSVFAKTETRRQSQLAALILRH
ncbi:helix-turn-helix transcriptional regulator [Streptococcus suis]|nr:helix-turn-helix transcriptional regulator [Streptococcus suis]